MAEATGEIHFVIFSRGISWGEDKETQQINVDGTVKKSAQHYPELVPTLLEMIATMIPSRSQNDCNMTPIMIST